MLRAALRLTIAAGTLFTMTFCAVLAWTFTWPDPQLETLDRADAVLCLGGGLNPDGSLPAAVQARVERCTQVQAATGTPLVIFTGGTRADDGTPAAHVMAQTAIMLGLPSSTALREGQSRSTLQNALFSLRIAPHTDRLILVTEAFHLPRSAASFRWAAWQLGLNQPQITLVMSEQVRRDPGPNWSMLLRESAAIWLNLLRAPLFSALPGASERLLD
ncbi:MAG: YdcF family protein [Pseudomonadota bacterium]